MVIDLLGYVAKNLSVIPITLIVLAGPDLKNWLHYFRKIDRVKLTETLLFIPKGFLTTSPWVIFLTCVYVFVWKKILWLDSINRINGGFVNLALPVEMFALSVAFWILMSNRRRIIRFNAVPLGLMLYRSGRSRFDVHIRASFRCNATGINARDFHHAFKAAITPARISEMRGAGASELVAASIWLHRESRIQELISFLSSVAPEAKVARLQIALGPLESFLVRLFQLVIAWKGKEYRPLRMRRLKVWVSFAKLAPGPFWTRPVMNGVVLSF